MHVTCHDSACAHSREQPVLAQTEGGTCSAQVYVLSGGTSGQAVGGGGAAA